MTRPIADSFQTYTGRMVHVTRPVPEDVCFEDLARALSRIQRYGGHCHVPYSVGEHSVLVSHLCNPNHALLGLLHDSSEAYCADIVTPLKRQMRGYKEIEAKWMLAIGEAVGVGDSLVKLPADVHIADTVALQTELRDLFQPSRSIPGKLPPSDEHRAIGLECPAAYRLFVRRFAELTGVNP